MSCNDVDLICSTCHKEFVIDKAEHYRLTYCNGESPFFCSISCSRDYPGKQSDLIEVELPNLIRIEDGKRVVINVTDEQLAGLKLLKKKASKAAYFLKKAFT